MEIKNEMGKVYGRIEEQKNEQMNKVQWWR